MTISVRAATADDVKAIVEVAVSAWEEGFRGIVPDHIQPRRAWDSERVRARLLDDGLQTQHMVAELAGRVRGYMVIGPSRDRDADAGVGEIWALYVHPEAWRQGLGQALVEQALEELSGVGFRSATLWTLAESPGARRFYEACGFALDGASQRRESFGSPLEIRYLRSLS